MDDDINMNQYLESKLTKFLSFTSSRDPNLR